MTDHANVQVKISRNGHCFLVDAPRELEPGVFVGRVASEGVPGFPLGSVIAFVDFKGNSEVSFIYEDGVEVYNAHRAPTLN